MELAEGNGGCGRKQPEGMAAHRELLQPRDQPVLVLQFISEHATTLPLLLVLRLQSLPRQAVLQS